MKVTVNFTNNLAKKIGTKSITIDASTYRDIVSACQNLLPHIKSVVKNRTILSMICKDRIVSTNELDFKVSESVVTIVPAVAGGAATSFDSLGNLDIFYGATKAYSNEEIFLTGLNRRIIDSSLYGQAKTAFDISQRAAAREDGTYEGNEDPSTGFGTLNISSIYGQPIPLHFGLVRASGAVINSYIKHIQRGSIDSVSVSDYV